MVSLSNYEANLSDYEREILVLLQEIQYSQSIGGETESLFQRVQNAADLIKRFTYDSIGTPDERIISITYTSASLEVVFTETYLYEGDPGAYRITAFSRVQNA